MRWIADHPVEPLAGSDALEAAVGRLSEAVSIRDAV